MLRPAASSSGAPASRRTTPTAAQGWWDRTDNRGQGRGDHFLQGTGATVETPQNQDYVEVEPSEANAWPNEQQASRKENDAADRMPRRLPDDEEEEEEFWERPDDATGEQRGDHFLKRN